MGVPKETWTDQAARLSALGVSAEAIEQYGKTLRNYYINPTIEWIDAALEASDGPIAKSGYYVLHYCETPECCSPEGPFKTENEARDWAQQNLVPGLPGGS